MVKRHENGYYVIAKRQEGIASRQDSGLNELKNGCGIARNCNCLIAKGDQSSNGSWQGQATMMPIGLASKGRREKGHGDKDTGYNDRGKDAKDTYENLDVIGKVENT